MLDNLLLGLGVVLTLKGLIFLILGCVLGTIVGTLPGIGTVTTLAILLPYTYGTDPVYTIIMMAGIYYGAQYGGSTTSILLNTPGEASSVMTCVDGYKLTKKGLGGQAIVAAGIASLIGGLISLALISFLSPLMSGFALNFGPKELALLMLLGLISISAITNKNLFAGIGVACIGILLGLVGTDVNTGIARFTGGNINLLDGISIPVISIGIFGIAEIFKSIFSNEDTSIPKNPKIQFGWKEFKRIIPSSLRGTSVGSVLGIIPGGGAIMASFAAYSLEKKFSKNKDELGNGALEGVAAPEAANNSASQVAFVPLLVLGIPENAVMALILGSLTVSGLTLGPGMIENNPELFWGLLVSMFLGNCILVVLNIPLVKIWLTLLKTPKKIFNPILFLISIIGIYYIDNSLFHVGLAIMFGLFGLILIKLNLEPAPLMFGFIIGPMFEENLRRSLIFSKGEFSYFLTGTTSNIILTIILFVLIFGMVKTFKK